MDKELKTRWVAALRSGEYEQGHARLENKGKFCCLGVLAKVVGLPTRTPNNNGGNSSPGDELYTPLANLLGGDFKTLWVFTKMNDMDGMSFSQIADYVETTL